MKFNVLKRNQNIFYIIYFEVLSMFIYAILANYNNYQSLFNLDNLKIFFTNNYPIILIWIILLVETFKVKKSSLYLYILFEALIIFLILKFFIIRFNILTVMIWTLLCFIIHYFYLLLNFELKSAYFNPIYDDESDYEDKIKIKIFVTIMTNNTLYNGYLTNWDQNSCFIRLENPLPKISTDLMVNLRFKEKDFQNNGKLVTITTNRKGVGIKFYRDYNDINNWYSLYNIIVDYGYLPNLVCN
ncbi:MAG: hypothetical protein U0T83_02005 [Bacteriovoracaceae bacterium]